MNDIGKPERATQNRVISIVIGILIVCSSWSLLKETAVVLMEGVPYGIDVDELRNALSGIADVRAVHDLHLWSITSGFDALSVHVAADRGYPGLLHEIRQMLHDRESPESGCELTRNRAFPGEWLLNSPPDRRMLPGARVQT